jgi:BirA family biotin operon repressor/biotin-[acetyl-CoA-carboxylase] ligase
LLSEGLLEQILARAGLSAPVLFEEVTRSTNDTALAMAAEGAPEWTLVAAGHQTAGRGRLGRRWLDEPGRSLMFSFVLRPRLPAEHLGLISLLAGWAAAAAARERGATDAWCKWPNDLLVGESKAGGILAEARVSGPRVEHVVMGVGINLGEPPTALPGAGAIEGAAGGELLEAFLRFFRQRYQPEHPAFPAAVVAGYGEVCGTIGKTVRATTVDGRSVEGTAVGLDERGGLMIEADGGSAVVAFSEILHVES